MLGQVCHRQCYGDSDGFQEVDLSIIYFPLIGTRVLFSTHDTQHSTCSIPNFPIHSSRILSNTAQIIAKSVGDPKQVIIKQSRPFRMRYPHEHPAFLRLFANVLCYLESGYSSVFYMAKDEMEPPITDELPDVMYQSIHISGSPKSRQRKRT